jgi:hypothetical protein
VGVVEPLEPVETVETVESKRRSRTTLIAVTAGVVVAASLVAYGFARSDDDRPDSDIPPTIGVIQAPAEVLTTQPLVVIPGSAPTTDDLPFVPDETVDIGAPPITSSIVVP